MITDLCQRGVHTYCWDENCACTACHHNCIRCHTRVKRVNADGVCAPCMRAEARTRVYPGTPCDNCGTVPAFRNPSHRRNEYLCTRCHKEADEPVKLAGSMAVAVTADCMGKDANDPAHIPVHVRGSRWQCSRCKTTLQSKDPGKTARVGKRQTLRNHGGY